MSALQDRELSGDLERELAALADGSLARERRERLLARVQRSPRLQDELASQQRALQLLAAADVDAPASLHERVGAMAAAAAPASSARPSAAAGAWRRRMRSRHRSRLGIAVAATTVLAGTIGIAMALGGSNHKTGQRGTRALSAAAAVKLALGPATLPAPAESRSNHDELAAAVGGVSFPYWKERFGWRGSGARADTLGGRAVTTVFYSNAAGQRIGYAIVAGPAPAAAGGQIVRRWGVSYRLSARGGANAIVWRRDGRLCVMAGRGVSPRTLLNLASWSSGPSQAA